LRGCEEVGRAADGRIVEGAVVEDEVLDLRRTGKSIEIRTEPKLTADAGVVRLRLREPRVAEVEEPEARRAAREREQVEARRARRILALPPRVDRRDVGGDRRRERGEPVRHVARDGVDDVNLVRR